MKIRDSSPGLYVINEEKGTLKIRKLAAWRRGLPNVLLTLLPDLMSLDYFRVMKFYNIIVCQDGFKI